jgi:hypothetical protein
MQSIVYADLTDAQLHAEHTRLKRFLKRAFVAVYRANAQRGIAEIEAELSSRVDRVDQDRERREEEFRRAERSFEFHREVFV